MKQEFTVCENDLEGDRPAGGKVHAIGLDIFWQKGAIVVDGERQEPNGVFVETVIAAALQRIEHYQSTRFNCEENKEAIQHLKAALDALDRRTKRRESEGTEGTHNGN